MAHENDDSTLNRKGGGENREIEKLEMYQGGRFLRNS